MKADHQDREGWLNTLSGLETLADLYIHKPVSRPNFWRTAARKAGLAPLLKKADRLFRPEITPMKAPSGDLKLNELDTRGRASLYFSDEETAVYTVLFGCGDKIRDPLVRPDNIRYFVITDQKLRDDSLWQKLDVSGLLPQEILGDPVLCNRWCKMHPDLLFPDQSASVYVDANIYITSDLTPLTAGLEQFPVNMFRHRTRNCAYQEIEACYSQKKISRETRMREKKRLQEHGLPEHWGLLEAPVIARRHHDPRCLQIMAEWWKDFRECASRRDQIALMDCLWQLQIPPEEVGILGSNVRTCSLFIQLQHIRPGKQDS